MHEVRVAINKMRAFLGSRALAYNHVFDPANQFTEVVLSDLAKFCRANESCFEPNERAHAVREGRREVFLRIQHHLKLSDEQLWALYGRKDLE